MEISQLLVMLNKQGQGLTESQNFGEKKSMFSNKQPQHNPQNAFRSLQQTIFNLFRLAKYELNIIYRGVVNEVKKLDYLFFNRMELSHEQFREAIQEIKEEAESKMGKITDVMPELFVTKSSFEKLSSSNSSINQRSLSQSMIKPRRQSTIIGRKTNVVNSVEELFAIDNKDSIKKIILNHPKTLQTNAILIGVWEKVEEISMAQKNLHILETFTKIKAPRLKHLNLSQNKIESIEAFCGSYYPVLKSFDLSSNDIIDISHLPETQFPSLESLNLSDNLIRCIDCLPECYFPDLIVLNLSNNILSSIEILPECDLEKLEILNLDHNKLLTMEPMTSWVVPKLKMLSFSGNEVYSLRFTIDMKTPKLQGLIGYENNIKSIYPLANANFPKLKEIVLHDNKISDISCVKDMKFELLRGFDLEKNKIKKKEVGCFLTQSQDWKSAKKKFPFLQL